jgi:nitrogen fixation protein NifZ
MTHPIELRDNSPASGQPRRKLREEIVELVGSPLFEEGDKVVSLKEIRNDGTYPGQPVGATLIEPGDVGYIKSIGTYLQMFYIYGVDFYEKRVIVGMRAHEMELLDCTLNDPK